MVGCGLVAVLVLMLAPGAGAAAGVDITAVEGRPFTGTVVNGLTCPLLSATITWGDSTTSAGASDGSPGIQGTHTYAEEGTYSGSVSYTYTAGGVRGCPTGVQTASFQATVQDALLTAGGIDVSGTTGQPLSRVVTHFSDANSAANAGDFSAQIVWGDGGTSAGTVAAAAGGGFDVSGAHTYQSAGSFMVSSRIADIGGATTTASSVAQIMLGAPPPIPRPAPPFALPEARFGFAPFSPCQNDNVSFDASSSTGGGDRLPITDYHWSIDESAFAPTQFTSAKPTFTHVFRAASYSVGPYEGPLPNKDLNDYHFLRPPATVTLEVTDSAGNTATASRTITFVDPDELLVGEVVTSRKTGLPFLDLFRDSRFRDVVPCQPRSLDPNSTVVKLARPTFSAVATLRQSGSGAAYRASIAVKSACWAGLVQCSGELIVSQDPRARGSVLIPGNLVRGALARSLGQVKLFLPAGRSATVIVRLNAHGRALARAHKLRTVIVRLRSLGANGKLVVTTRTVRL